MGNGTFRIPFPVCECQLHVRLHWHSGSSQCLHVVPPGSFIQIDESRDKVVEGAWRSESDRPIYFLKREAVTGVAGVDYKTDNLLCNLTLSLPEPVRIYRHPKEADVVGEVVGVAMQIRRRE